MWTRFNGPLAGRFPENTVLSHDLIEACHARSALVSDVEFYEEYPSRYNSDINRRHRWIRGDWQIAQWLLPRVPGPDARRVANPLSSLSQWKILDNLRRSLVPAALLLLLLANWMLFPDLGALGPLLVLSIITLPAILSATVELFRKPRESSLALHLRGLVGSSGRQFGQALLTFVFLPYDAFVSLDAISRTLVRLLVTRKRLLEWQTASDAERIARNSRSDFYATMWVAPSDRTGLRVFPGLHPLFAIVAGGADPGAVAGLSLDRLAHQPADRTFGRATFRHRSNWRSSGERRARPGAFSKLS